MIVTKAGRSGYGWRVRVAVLLWVVCFAGCATPDPYRGASEDCTLGDPVVSWSGRSVWESREGRCAASWSVVHETHRVNYIEIDEQGVLRSRAAMEAALAAAAAPAPAGQQAYVVVFVHGWHHDASPDDGNVQAFHTALAKIKAWHPKDDVRGIFVGWRGESVPLPGLSLLSFWDRKNTSDEVGRGGLLEFLLRLEHAVKGDPLLGTRDAKLVLVGHSFGASVTFNALAHVYMSRFMDGLYDTREASRFRGYGDLVVLINPAIEAMRYMPFQGAVEYYARDSAKPRADFRYEDLPRLVILSSEGDWATRYAFRGARFFSTAVEQHGEVLVASGSKDIQLGQDDAPGKYNEWTMDQQTVGNFERFHTHVPLRLSYPEGSDPPESPAQCTLLQKEDVRRLLSTNGAAFPDSNIVTTPLPKRALGVEGAPYLIADVEKNIVRDHTDIANPHLLCWINQLVGNGD